MAVSGSPPAGEQAPDLELLTHQLQTRAGLTPGIAAVLRQASHRARQFTAGETILDYGHHPDAIHLVFEGWAARTIELPDGGRQIAALLLPGDFCTFTADAKRPLDHRVQALSRTKILSLPRGAARRFLAEEPDAAEALELGRSREEAMTRHWLANVSCRRAAERLGCLFCELEARLSRLGLVEGRAFFVPLTQTQLSETLGMSAVHVNRSLHRLRDADLAYFRRGRVEIPDVAHLADVCSFDPGYLLDLGEHAATRRAAR